MLASTLHTIRCLLERQRALTANQQEKKRWFTSDSPCGYCFLSRSVEAKGTCCIFWMLVTLVMPTGCGLSIRRLRRSRRTWQPYRYISSQCGKSHILNCNNTLGRQLFQVWTHPRGQRGRYLNLVTVIDFD